MVVDQPKEIVSFFREVASYPSISSAEVILSNDGRAFNLQSYWSQRDIDRKEKTTYQRSHTISIDTGTVLAQSSPQEVKNEVWNKVSPSGKLQAVVRSGKDKKNEDKQYLEIFDQTRKLKTVDILALEKHGKIIDNDGQFGSFEWSSSEGHLLYMAEKKKPKTGSYFDSKAFKDVDGGDNEDDVSGDKKDTVIRGDEYVNEETWGEQLTERVHSVICILDIETNTVSVLENVPDDLSPGQAKWTPDDAGVVFCAWSHEPYRLGLKFCSQRKSFLYYLDIQKGSLEILNEEGRAVRFPYFSPDMSKLVYLDLPVGGAHNQCNRLIKIDWATRERKVVVDEVRQASAGEFPGLYMYGMNGRVWLGDNTHVVIGTSWRSTSAVVVVNTDTGKVQRLVKDSFSGALDIVCVKDSLVVLSASSLDIPFHLLVGKFSTPGDLSSLTWIYPDGQPEALSWLSWKVLQHHPTKERQHPQYPSLDYESILCLPQKKEGNALPPLIVFSHGGPNTAFSEAFNPITSFFCLCGYAVVMVNYRGSVGFGQDSIVSLTGNIGTQDVKDVESVMVEVLAKGVADGNRILAFGGSHGGFLTTHLIGQYPDTFRAAATRNPVVNLTSMFSTSDIRDWIFAQSGLPFDYRSLADDKLLPYLWKRSPMAYVDQVKTPVMLMIGLEDKRVPPAQGQEYWKALKARGVPVRYLTYPGNNHSISEVAADADCMVNTIMWFNKYIA